MGGSSQHITKVIGFILWDHICLYVLNVMVVGKILHYGLQTVVTMWLCFCTDM